MMKPTHPPAMKLLAPATTSGTLAALPLVGELGATVGDDLLGPLLTGFSSSVKELLLSARAGRHRSELELLAAAGHLLVGVVGLIVDGEIATRALERELPLYLEVV